jgi:hypothetical protein
LSNSNVLHNEYSNTIRNEKEKKIWDSQREKVETYYSIKWGGTPGNEKYNTAWNLRK